MIQIYNECEPRQVGNSVKMEKLDDPMDRFRLSEILL